MKQVFSCLLSLLLTSCAALHGGHAKSAQEPVDLARLRALAGTWKGKANHGQGEATPAEVHFRLTGGGSALVETLFPGTPHEMVTVYHADGSDLVLTHYCAAGNQPRMRLATPGAQELVFEFDGGSNLDATVDGHMHNVRIEIVDPDHLRTRWTFYQGGKSDHDTSFDLTRVR
jgi:hypothetical protein